MISNTRYITLLDSATSAYSANRRPHEVNWWLPNDEQRTKAMIFGSTSVMYRLLFGDVLRLPRNQAFDSPAFFNIFEGLQNVEQRWLTVSVLTKLRPTPLLFVKDVANQFNNENFLLSAWPSLDQKQRNRIYENIKRTGNFREMLHGVGEIYSPYDVTFQRQRELLQYVFEYLQKHPEALHKSSGVSKSLWDRLLDKNILEQLGTSSRILQAIPDRIGESENINNRGVLYKYIAEFTDVRDTIREVIDQQYHCILAESVANGRIDIAQGLFSNIKVDTLAQQVNAGDMQYDQRGLRLIYAHSIEENNVKNISSLSWKDIELVLGDSEFQRRMDILRCELSISEGERVQDVLLEHLHYLVEFIPNKVISESDNSSLTFGCKHIDREGHEKLVKVISSFFGPLSGSFEVAMERVFDRLLESQVRKQRHILAGRIRDWLQSLGEEEKKSTNDD